MVAIAKRRGMKLAVSLSGQVDLTVFILQHIDWFIFSVHSENTWHAVPF